MRQSPALAQLCGATTTTVPAVSTRYAFWYRRYPDPDRRPGAVRALGAAGAGPRPRRETPAAPAGRPRPRGGPGHPGAGAPAAAAGHRRPGILIWARPAQNRRAAPCPTPCAKARGRVTVNHRGTRYAARGVPYESPRAPTTPAAFHLVFVASPGNFRKGSSYVDNLSIHRGAILKAAARGTGHDLGGPEPLVATLASPPDGRTGWRAFRAGWYLRRRWDDGGSFSYARATRGRLAYRKMGDPMGRGLNLDNADSARRPTAIGASRALPCTPSASDAERSPVRRPAGAAPRAT